MIMKLVKGRYGVKALLVIFVIGSLVLGACDGMALNVQVDENDDGSFTITGDGDDGGGDGTIVITGDDQSDDPSLDTNTVLLFGVILAIFFGVIALVISSARRPRQY